ncbi:putative MATE family efflux protein [Pullulanibacillus pueri]|uniref:Putative transporter YisQ n=1 Tax=Pullulanibacillus pueri TaxID=1437324 RepID=A0A8J2ZZH3_9BACL|nr:MATE family efflux transporter [Pullulanibacillus pueri]MBM7680548.1 putative MATE family efflux protein [Pullulanibacillus pueri]GGH88395.1 putative transporter YisQ [Pullulanibacillus pueri]
MGQKTSLSLFHLTWPIFIELMLQMLMGSADTLMLSQYSDQSVGAVGFSNQVLQVITVLFGFVATGTVIMVSKSLGAKNETEALNITYTSIVINALFGLSLSLVLSVFGKQLLRLLNIPDAFMHESQTYLIIVGGFIFVQAINITIGATLRSYGFTKDAMTVTIGINILNIIGNFFFIFGPFFFPSLGVLGAALSTSVSRVIGLIILGILLIKRTGVMPRLHLFLKHKREHIKQILEIGIPSAGEQLSYDLSQMFITYFVTLIGTEAITTKIYVQNIMMFIYLFSLAIGEGSQIIIGHYMGAGKLKQAYHRGINSMKYGFVGSLVMAILFYLMAGPLLKIFTDDPDILSIGKGLLFITILLEPGRAFNLILISALRSVGDVRFPVIMGMFSMWLIGLPIAWLCAITLDLGLLGIWISFIVDEWVRGIFMLIRWRGRAWEKTLFIKPKEPRQEMDI